MPSYRAPYTLYTRRLSNGKNCYYYRTYTDDGKRTSGLSTGCTTKRAANKYCRSLITFNAPQKNKSFKSYASDYFGETSLWYKDLIMCDVKLSDNYIANLRLFHKNHIMPYFEQCGLSEVVPSKIKDFRIKLKEKELSNKTINIICGTLKIITDTAVNDGIMKIDPFKGVRRLEETENERDAFTVDEAKSILAAKWKKQNQRDASLVAAVTGLRIGEIMAIRRDTVHEDYIDVQDQRTRDKNEFVPVKGREKRKVPICPEVRAIIERNIKDGGLAFPMTSVSYRNNLYDCFTPQLAKEQKERNLTFHSWRHLFNTFMLAENVNFVKVKSCMGHSTGAGSMQERYTNWRPDMFPEVYKAQEKLIKELLI